MGWRHNTATTLERRPSQPLQGGRTIPCAGRQVRYAGRPLVMGVLNVTPDSFSDGGAYEDSPRAIRRALEMVEEGADAIDVGGESTRPGAREVSLDEELRRVLPVIERLAEAIRVPISIDTSKAEVARRALEAGADIVNDVTALRGDPRMLEVVAQHNAAVILMHMRGVPRTMQRRPRYHHVVEEVATFLTDAAERTERAGVAHSSILIDPGLGFGKTVAHNLTLMKALPEFVGLGFPVVIGPSRKSFLGETLQADLADRVWGTLGCVAYAHRCGVHVVRVHDVRPAVHLLRMLEAIENP
ncbi:MAG: dihydropteroate synthase [Candidatus Omnitrophica bacterium]|nr:dihydropteroate synthase [Candidatus Omnitrophota bacterium]